MSRAARVEASLAAPSSPGWMSDERRGSDNRRGSGSTLAVESRFAEKLWMGHRIQLPVTYKELKSDAAKNEGDRSFLSRTAPNPGPRGASAYNVRPATAATGPMTPFSGPDQIIKGTLSQSNMNLLTSIEQLNRDSYQQRRNIGVLHRQIGELKQSLYQSERECENAVEAKTQAEDVLMAMTTKHKLLQTSHQRTQKEFARLEGEKKLLHATIDTLTSESKDAQDRLQEALREQKQAFHVLSEEHDSLQANLKRLTAEHDATTAALHSTKTQVGTSRQTLGQLKATLKETKEALEEQSSKSERLEKSLQEEREKHVQQLYVLEAQLAKTKKENEKLESEQASVREALELATGQGHRDLKEIKRLTANSSNLKERIVQLTNQVKSLEAQNVNYQMELNSSNAEKMKMESEYTAFQRDHDEQVAKLVGENSSLNQTLTTMQDTIDRLNEELQAHIVSSARDREKADRTISKGQAKLERTQDQLTQKSLYLQQAKDKTVELEAKLAKANGIVDARGRQIASLKGEVSTLNTTVASTQMSVQRLTNSLKEKEQALATAKLQVEESFALRDQLSVATQTAAELKNQVTALTAAHAPCPALISSLQKQLAALKVELRAVRERAKLLEPTQERVGELETALADKTQALASANGELETQRERVDELAAAHESCHEVATRLEETTEELVSVGRSGREEG